MDNMPEEKKSNAAEEKIAMPHRGGGNRIIMAIIAAIIVVVLLVAIYATGALSGGKTKTAVTLTGAGATFPMPLIQEWAKQYYNVTKGEVRINYAGGGSGAGISQIKNKQVDFAGSDAPLKANETSEFGLVHIPETLGAVVLTYNYPSLGGTLKLNGSVLAKIFLKNITAWNDPEIAALNPGLNLGSQTILTAARSDSSGTTFVFSGYLKIASSTWSQLKGQGKTISWPEGTVQLSGNAGVAGYVKTNSFSIGYVELTYAASNQMTFAQMRNADDTAFVTPSLESTAAAAVAKASSLPAGDGDWSTVNILNQPGTNTYPIASFTYILVYKELYNDQTKMNKTAAKDLLKFVWWAVHDGGQQYSESLSYPTLPASVVSLDEQTLRSITYNGSPLL